LQYKQPILHRSAKNGTVSQTKNNRPGRAMMS
jgi:hypothetical protein